MLLRPFAPLIPAVLLMLGCQKNEVQAYRVPKETVAPPVSAPAASSAGLVWRAPEHWQEKPAGGVRRGSFIATNDSGETADISIIAFPGDVGGLAANLNRWRTQVGLGSLPDAEVEATVQHLDTPYFHVDFVNYLGESSGVPSRVAGAILHHDEQSWFFKIIGPVTVVDAELDAFNHFLQTVAPATP